MKNLATWARSARAGSLCCLVAAAAAGCAMPQPAGYAYTTADTMASKVGVRPSLARYVVHRESRGNMAARNSASSATGAMQVIDGTAAAIAGRHVSRAERKTTLGIAIGVAYLKTCQLALPYAGDHSVWTRCYVRGHGAVGGDIAHAQQAFRILAQ